MIRRIAATLNAQLCLVSLARFVVDVGREVSFLEELTGDGISAAAPQLEYDVNVIVTSPKTGTRTQFARRLARDRPCSLLKAPRSVKYSRLGMVQSCCLTFNYVHCTRRTRLAHGLWHMEDD